jgi:hypothetical protein
VNTGPGHYAECQYVACHILYIVMLSVVMLCVVMLSVVAPLQGLLTFKRHAIFLEVANTLAYSITSSMETKRFYKILPGRFPVVMVIKHSFLRH